VNGPNQSINFSKQLDSNPLGKQIECIII